jgi:type II secretory pathway pseudopilin PulG
VKSSTRGRRAGFSYIEVLLAIFLVVTSATIVLSTMPLSTSSRIKADYLNRATSLAQKQLEAIRGRGYQNATVAQLYAAGLIDSTTPIATNTYAFTNSDSAALDNPAKVLPTGTGSVQLDQIVLDLRRVIVKVNYVERGKPRSVTVGTMIANL